MKDEEASWRDVTRKRGCWAKVHPIQRGLCPGRYGADNPFVAQGMQTLIIPFQKGCSTRVQKHKSTLVLTQDRSWIKRRYLPGKTIMHGLGFSFIWHGT